MSWQSRFDAKGPNWNGNAAVIAEEKRIRNFMEESKNGKVEPIIDPTVMEELDQKMTALYNEEQTLLHQLRQCEREQDKLHIRARIDLARKQFLEIKERYVQFRQA